MNEKASVTALMSAFVRAYIYETESEPVFADSIARRFFSDEEYEKMAEYIVSGAEFFALKLKGKEYLSEDILYYIVNTHLAPTPVARAKYCEDCLKTAVMTGAEQYVILGAGYDSFAWREPELMKKLTVFEADHPSTQKDKKERLRRAGLETPGNFHFVPIDFSVDDLKEKLIECGFDTTKKTFFSWLGVSYYLSDSDVRRMFSAVSSFAAEGSTIVFDYADERLFSSEVLRLKNMLAMAEAGGEPMKFCCESVYLEKMLEEYSLYIYEFLTPDDIDVSILGDSVITAFEHINYVTAVVKNTGHIHTKEKIQNTALRLFARYGYEAVSVRDIAGDLCISQAALYKHYKSKRDIFDSILRRMEESDAQKAQESGVPQKSYEQETESYENAELSNLKEFSESMFRYWTQDAFAVYFRRMLTLEQYSSTEMENLYKKYFSQGPLCYTEDILREAGCREPKKKALEFYAPMLMLIQMYDTAENKNDVRRLFEEHIQNFKLEE